jgi:hypothetical protein
MRGEDRVRHVIGLVELDRARRRLEGELQVWVSEAPA